MAANECRLEILQHLIESTGLDANLPTENTGWTALHLAINNVKKTESLECVKYLLKVGADVNW